MSRVIQPADDRLIQVMVVTQNAQGSRLKIQSAGFESGQRNPARGEDAKYVPMGEDEHVALERTNPGNDTIRARTHLRQRFPAGATLLEQTPARALGPNVRRASSFVRAVVPFHQIGIDLRAIAE